MKNKIKSASQLAKVTSNPKLIKLATEVFIAISKEETIEEVVVKYENEILKENQWKKEKSREVILDTKYAWLMSDEDFEIYMKLVHKKHIENGFDVEYGYCPLLIAKTECSDAKRAMINGFAPYIGFSYDDVSFRLESYHKYVDLILKMMASKVNK